MRVDPFGMPEPEPKQQMPEEKSFWDHAEEAAREVASWPEWKRRSVDASLKVEPEDTSDWGRYSWWPP